MIDEKKLIECMDERFKKVKDKVQNNLAEGFMQMEKLIKEQPKVGEWIPCSERLPKDSGDVIIVTKSSIVGVGSYFEDGKNWVQWYSGGGIAVDVIAWMPLPAPYIRRIRK